MASQFIVVTSDLKLSIRTIAPKQGVAISTHKESCKAPAVYINGIPAQGIVRGFRDALGDIEAEDEFARTGQEVAFCLAPPDPWLLAICTIMWEGILQGVAWDVVKASICQHLPVLSKKGLAPMPGTKQKSSSFSLTGYVEIGQLFRVFGRLEQQLNAQERFRIPSIEQPPMREVHDSLVEPAKEPSEKTAKRKTGKRKTAKKKRTGK